MTDHLRGFLEMQGAPFRQPDCPPTVKLTVPLADAMKAKRQSWWRGLAAGGFAVAVLWAGTAFSGDTATWGGTGCQLIPVTGQAYVAEVRCVNVQTRGETVTAGDMAVDDLAVHLVIIHGPGDIPDMFTVTPPVGFVAIPPDMSLDENARGTVLIMPWLGG